MVQPCCRALDPMYRCYTSPTGTHTSEVCPTPRPSPGGLKRHHAAAPMDPSCTRRMCAQRQCQGQQWRSGLRVREPVRCPPLTHLGTGAVAQKIWKCATQSKCNCMQLSIYHAWLDSWHLSCCSAQAAVCKLGVDFVSGLLHPAHPARPDQSMDGAPTCTNMDHSIWCLGQHAVLAPSETWRVQRPARAAGSTRNGSASASPNATGFVADAYVSTACRPLLNLNASISSSLSSETSGRSASQGEEVAVQAVALLASTVPVSGSTGVALTNSTAWSNTDGHVGANWRRHILRVVAGLSDAAWLAFPSGEAGSFRDVSSSHQWLHEYAIRDPKAGLFLPWNKLRSAGPDTPDSASATLQSSLSSSLPDDASAVSCCSCFGTARPRSVREAGVLHSAVPAHAGELLNDTLLADPPESASLGAKPRATQPPHSKYTRPWSDEEATAGKNGTVRPSIVISGPSGQGGGGGGRAVGPLPLSPNPPTPGIGKSHRDETRGAVAVGSAVASPARSVRGVSLQLRGGAQPTPDATSSRFPVRALNFAHDDSDTLFSNSACSGLTSIADALLAAAGGGGSASSPERKPIASGAPPRLGHVRLQGMFASVLDAARQRVFQTAVRHTLVLFSSAAGSSATRTVMRLAAESAADSGPRDIEHTVSNSARGVYHMVSPPFTLFDALSQGGVLRERPSAEGHSTAVAPLDPLAEHTQHALHPSALPSAVAECALALQDAFGGGAASTVPPPPAALGHHTAVLCPPSPWLVALLKVFFVPLVHTLSSLHPGVATLLLLTALDASVGGLLSALRWQTEHDGVFCQPRVGTLSGKDPPQESIVRLAAGKGGTGAFKGLRPPPHSEGASVTHFGGVQLCADLLYLRTWVALGAPIASKQAVAAAPPLPERCEPPLSTLHIMEEAAHGATRWAWELHVRAPAVYKSTGSTLAPAEALPPPGVTPLARAWHVGSPMTPCLPTAIAAAAGASKCWAFAHDVLKRLTPPSPPSTPSAAPGGAFKFPPPDSGIDPPLTRLPAAVHAMAQSMLGTPGSGSSLCAGSALGAAALGALQGGGLSEVHGAPSEWIGVHEHSHDAAAQQWLLRLAPHGVLSADASGLQLPCAFLGCSQ